jgi:hypothetical protein
MEKPPGNTRSPGIRTNRDTFPPELLRSIPVFPEPGASHPLLSAHSEEKRSSGIGDLFDPRPDFPHFGRDFSRCTSSFPSQEIQPGEPT